ncbi:MAG: Maf family protein [Blautia sp.]|nr:Maf family protein [Blautia sp.]
MEKIILASASPRRRELFEKAGISFSVMPSKAEEKTTCESPEDIVKELSFHKAKASQKELDDMKISGGNHVIIGADTIVALDGRILGKPDTEETAVKMLMALQGKTHQVYTGVTLMWQKENNWTAHTFSECTDVTFYPVSEKEIREYTASGEPMDKAGAYGIQGSFFVHVKGICGDYNNVVGLPVARLFYEAKKLGIDLKG